MRTRFGGLLLAAACIGLAACAKKPPQPAPAPEPLSPGAAAALRWIDAHAVYIPIGDSARASSDWEPFLTFVGVARVLGVSELVEGTHEFPGLIQRMLGELGANANFRGIAVQGPMAEALDVDRYVRTGTGNPKLLLRAVGEHYETKEVLALVEWMRDYNKTREPAQQIGFYGFELPTAARAVRVVASLPDSVAGAPLSAWLKQQVQCVATGERAAWGLGGAAADSGFWQQCKGVTAAIVDSVVALRTRIGNSPKIGDVVLAEKMARLLQHHVTVGLKHLPRQEVVAEHLLFVLSQLRPSDKLLVWGRDVESGRLILEGNTVQSAVVLSKALGDGYRNLAFTVGDGDVRARAITPGAREPGGEGTVRLRPPTRQMFEDVFIQSKLDAFFADMRPVVSDTMAFWLKGPRQARLISGLYAEAAPQAFETRLEFPAYYDGVLFARKVRAASRL